MFRVVLILMLLASIASADSYIGIQISDSNIDADGSFFVVAHAPLSSTNLFTTSTRMTLQIRPIIGNISSAYTGDWITDFWGYANQSYDRSPELFARTAIVDSVGDTWVTFVGATEANDTSYYFNEDNNIEWRVSFIDAGQWDGGNLSRSVWLNLESDTVTPNPGANITIETTEIGVPGFFTTQEENNIGWYSTKIEYWETDILSWEPMLNQAGEEWSDISLGCTNLYMNFVGGHQDYCTDGTTRVYFKDADGNEGGPYAGPNIIGVDGITGVCP